jgi:hypothetical protein
MIKAALARRRKMADFNPDVKLGCSDAHAVPYKAQNRRAVDANFHFVLCG